MLYISIIFNIILVLLLIFKSVLNDILKEWWIDRKKKKEKAINRLVDFKVKFNIYQSQNLLIIINLALKQISLIKGREVEEFIEDTYQSSLSMSSGSRSSISEFVDFLPADLRSCYERYNEQFTEILKNIMEGHVGKEDVMGYSEKITSLALECTNLSDSIVRKNLD